MFAVDVCALPTTGSSVKFALVAIVLLIVGIFTTRWVSRSSTRLSVVLAPLVLLGGLGFAPSASEACEPASSKAAPITTTTTTAVAVATTVASTTSSSTSSTSSSSTSSTTSSTTTSSTTSTTAAPVVYTVGQTGPGGGVVFYDAGSTQSWGRYLEAACAGWSDGTCGGTDTDQIAGSWGCYGTNISGAEGTAIGTGEQNTADIVAGCATAGIAARLADDLVLGGQTDWFLPSRDELAQVYSQRTNVGGLTLGAMIGSEYWSSGEYSSAQTTNAAVYVMGSFSGGANNAPKNMINRYMRPIRAF